MLISGNMSTAVIDSVYVKMSFLHVNMKPPDVHV